MNTSKHNACLNLLYLNARSILPKLDELRVLCVDNSYDIVCIIESWLSDEVANTELCIPGFNILEGIRIDMVVGLLFLSKILYLALSNLL